MGASSSPPGPEASSEGADGGGGADGAVESESATGVPVFCARLSSSFALVAIRREPPPSDGMDGRDGGNDEDGDGEGEGEGAPEFLDVVVSRKASAVPPEQDLESVVRAAELRRERGLPLTFRGRREPCPCREGCPRAALLCRSLDELPMIPDHLDVPATLCREVDDDASAAPRVDASHKRRRPRVRNRGRSARFAELLVDVLGLDHLEQSSGGILDVAGGGTGGLHFELSFRRGVPSVVIDPRPVKLNKTQRNSVAFRRRGREVLAPGLGISHRAEVLYSSYEEWTPRQALTTFDGAFAASEEGHRMLRECPAVVGMHPDEATDAVLELATRYGKPWFVCPCCVFPNAFRRELADGTEVRNYEQLCEYVKGFCDGVKEVTLDFEGRNRVFYWLPGDWSSPTIAAPSCSG